MAQVFYDGRGYLRIKCNFSCGAASAVATKKAIERFGHENVVIVYQETNSEHPDNERFLKDCEKWFGLPVMRQRSTRYADIYDVFKARRYLRGRRGAPCTSELKRRPAEENLDFFNELEVFGYTAEESDRSSDFVRRNPERKICPILIEEGITKAKCYAVLKEAGIQLPAMYLLGYNNNNCIGCVKGGIGYWNKIRKDFPQHFEKMAILEREIGATVCVKRVKRRLATAAQLAQWDEEASDERKAKADSQKDPTLRLKWYLDEIPPNAGNHRNEAPISCGIMCGE